MARLTSCKGNDATPSIQIENNSKTNSIEASPKINQFGILKKENNISCICNVKKIERRLPSS